MKRRPTKLINVLVALSLMLGFAQTFPVMAQGATPQATTTMGFSPTSAAATTCGTVEVDVMVNDAVALTGYHLEMTFDHTKLEVVDVVNGGLLYDAPDRAGLYEPVLDKGNTTGRLIWGMAQRGVNGDPTPVTGSGSLVKITLKALATSGLDVLTIDSTKTVLVDWPDAFAIPYTVSGTATVSLASCSPTDIALSNATVAENAPAPALVGSLSATDPDPADTTFTYSLVDTPSYPDNLSFAIALDKLNTAVVLNYEVKNSYQIKIRATDPHGAYYDKVFTISVTDVNDAPVLAPIGAKSLKNSATLSFFAAATDEDMPAQTLTWTVGAGSPAWVSVVALTGEVTLNPTVSTAPGSYSAEICVSDGALSDCKTFAITVTDGVAPVLESVSPPHNSTILLGIGDTFKLTVDALDDNLRELEVDHSMETTLPEFSVYASESDPYGGEGAAFAAAGVSVTYDAATQTWVIDFGPTVSGLIASNGGITFYLVLKDMEGNTWGSMSPTTPANTFKYFVNQDLDRPTISGIVARGGVGYPDVTAVGTTLTVDEGYKVATIEITMSEPVTVALGTVVSMDGIGPYGTVTAVNGAVITVTPNAGSETAAIVGSFTFSVPAGAVEDLAGNAWTNVPITLVVKDITPPVLTVSGATADGTAMAGNLADGYILPTTNNPALDHLVQMSATVSEPLQDTYFGLKFVESESTITAAELKAYYDARGVPEPYLSYLKGAVDGTNPVVYIKGSTVKLVDAAKHDIQAKDVDMTVPDDFPLGTYVVRGQILDAAGNPTTVTLKLIITGDRVAPTVVSGKAFGATGFGDVDAVGLAFTVDQGYTVDHIEFVMSEAVEVLPGTMVTLGGNNYGNVSASGSIITITPLAGNEVASVIGGPFTFSIPAGSIKDLAGNALVTLSATLTVNNVAPVAVDDAYITNEDESLTVTAPGVLANDTDFPGTTLTAELVNGPTAAQGSITLNPDGSFTFVPAADFHGTVTFTYKAFDGGLYSNEATVTITVNSVLDPPSVTSSNLPGPYMVGLEQEFQVTLTNPSNGDAFSNVLARFRLEGINLSDIASFTYLETSVTPNQWLDLPLSQDGADVIGNFGPATGFPMGVPYNATSKFKITFNTPGIYPATVVLYDLTPDPDFALASYSANVEVVADFAVTDVVLTRSTDQVVWYNVPGSFAGGFTMPLLPTQDWYYLGVGSLTATRALADGSYPFTLTAHPGSAFFDYWAAKGVVSGATGWQGAMWQIINGNAPMFYLKVVGNTYTLIDGLQGGANLLRVNGDYYPGQYTYSGSVADTLGFTDAVSVNILFNDIPMAENQAVTTAEDTPVAITLTASDIYHGTLVWAVGTPAHGILSGTAPNLTYTPAADFNGTDSFTFSVSDGALVSNTATVTITVTPVNDAPVAQDQSVTTAEDTAKAITLVATDVDGDSLTYTVVVGPAHGTLSGTAPNLTYTPAADFNGTDSFTFKANDGTVDSNVATVTITVTPVNDAPVAMDQSVTTAEDTAKAITLVATDVDGDALTYTVVAGPTHGTLSGTAPNLTYTPAADFNGTDSFTFKANDGTADSNVATVTITVTPVNDAPVAVNDSYSTSFKTTLTVSAPGVLLNDSDVEGDHLTAVLVTGVTNGTLTLNADGSFTYVPSASFVGLDTFTYKANDGALDSNIATVTIAVTSYVNTPPVAVADTYWTDENVELVVPAPGVLTNDYDVDGDVLAATLKTNVSNGILVLKGDGSFTYKPKADWCGTDSFVYTLVSHPGITSDGWTADATVTITVYCDAIISSNDIDGPFYVGNLQEFHVRLQNPAPGHVYGSLAASVFVDNIKTTDYSSIELKHPLTGTWVPLTPVVDGNGLRLNVGPISAMPLTSGFDQTLTFRINFNTPGSYPVTGTLYDGAIDPAKTIATYSDTMLVAGLLAQDFGYMSFSGVMGVSAGFGNVNFDLSQATQIKVELFTGAAPTYQLMQTNTAVNPTLMAGWPQFSSPFDIFGTFNYAADGYWNNVRAAEYGQTAIPTRVLATVSLPGGITLTAENTILTGDRGYIVDTLDEELASAPDYDYTPPYIPVGVIDFDIASNTYTGTYTAPQVLAGYPMNDLARYLGALYRQPGSTITSIVYAGKTYTWDVTGTLAGSNWEDNTGKTLVSQVTDDFQAAVAAGTWDPNAGWVMTVHDDYLHSATVTFKLVILNTLDPEIASAPTYAYVPPYTYVGSYAFEDATNIYTVTYNDTTFIPGSMNDLARYLGALHRQAGATVFTIEYKGTIYSWNPAEPNVGSNWYAGSTSLVSVITAEALAGQIDPAVGFTLKLSDAFHTENVTFRYIINDTTAPTVISITAKGAAGFGDVMAVGTTLTVDQGYKVDHTEIVVSEPVKVAAGTVVTLAGQPYGTITVDSTGLILTITPYPGNEIANLVGSFVFSIPSGSVTDLAGNPIGTLSVTLVVNNIAPVAVADAYTILEDAVLTVAAPGVLGNDIDYDVLTAILVSGPANGSLTLNADGSFVYMPDLNWHGTDTFTYKANDGMADSNVATVTITVTPVNDAPVAQDQSVTTAEDTAKAITLVATDVDGDTLTYTVVVGPAHGTLSGTAPNLTYTPAADFNGTDSFTFKANDGTVDSNVATVTITVTPVNDAPVAMDQSVTTAEDTAKAITLVATDVDGDSLTYTVVAGPAHGTLSGTAPNLTYTPAADFNGTDSFTFKANDGTVDSNVATVTITVTPVNDAPVLAAIANATIPEMQPYSFTATATDVDSTNLTYSLVGAPTGAAIDPITGVFTWTPTEAQGPGVYSFTVKVCDDASPALCDEQEVTFTVTEVNLPPVLGAIGNKTVEAAAALTFTATATDADIPVQTLTFSINGAPAGAAINPATGVFTWTPSDLQVGSHTFEICVSDGYLSDCETIIVTVTARNAAPVALNDTYITDFETTLTVAVPGVLGNDSDPESDPLTAIKVTDPAHGTLTLNADGSFTYVPAAGYSGFDSFTYKANDGELDSNIATVTIMVREFVNTAPVAQAQSVETPEDTAKAITLVATDIDGQPLTYAIVTQPAHGTVTLVGAVATYTPSLNYNGSDSFTFKANDGLIDSNVATVTITVTPVNDAPVAVDDHYTVAEKDTLTVAAPGVLANDIDVDGDILTAILVDTVQHGTLTLNSDGSFTYTPTAYFNGTDSFTYKAKDAELESDLAVVTITVTPVNDWPIANDDYYETVTGVPLVKDAAEGILANDVLLDPDEHVSILILEGPQHGTLVMNNDGSFTYTPDAGFMGTDTFRYMVLSVRIQAEWHDEATVTILVKPYLRLFLPIILS